MDMLEAGSGMKALLGGRQEGRTPSNVLLFKAPGTGSTSLAWGLRAGPWGSVFPQGTR